SNALVTAKTIESVCHGIVFVFRWVERISVDRYRFDLCNGPTKQEKLADVVTLQTKCLLDSLANKNGIAVGRDGRGSLRNPTAQLANGAEGRNVAQKLR